MPLEDMYKGSVRKLQSSRRIKCPACDGTGSKSGRKQPCRKCDGTGTEVSHASKGGQACPCARASTAEAITRAG